jgi:hypothetical protein
MWKGKSPNIIWNLHYKSKAFLPIICTYCRQSIKSQHLKYRSSLRTFSLKIVNSPWLIMENEKVNSTVQYSMNVCLHFEIFGQGRLVDEKLGWIVLIFGRLKIMNLIFFISSGFYLSLWRACRIKVSFQSSKERTYNLFLWVWNNCVFDYPLDCKQDWWIKILQIDTVEKLDRQTLDRQISFHSKMLASNQTKLVALNHAELNICID